MRPRFLAVVATILVMSASLARAQYPIDTGAYKCQAAVSKGLGKYAGAREKCVQKCRKTAAELGQPQSGCVIPSGGSGDSAYDCVFDLTKGTVAKLGASVVKACTKDASDCPTCYAGGNCSSYATSASMGAELSYYYGQAAVFCAELPTDAEFRCMVANAKALGKLEAAVRKCYAKCAAGEQVLKIPAGACSVPPSDPATDLCLTKVQAKAAALIDKACFTVPVAAPSCYDGEAHPPGVVTFTSGTAWAAQRAVTSGIASSVTFCGP